MTQWSASTSKAIDVAAFAAITFLLWLGVMAFASSIAGYVTILLGMAAAAFKVPARIMKLTSEIKVRFGLNPLSWEWQQADRVGPGTDPSR